MTTAIKRVKAFLPELVDIPDEKAAAQRGAAMLVADIRTILDALERALEHLHRVVDHQDDECIFDHHGGCQNHFTDGTEPGKCGIAEARAFLAEHDGDDGDDGDHEAS